MALTQLFTDQATDTASEATPVKSASFDCNGPYDPVTVSCEDLKETDVIEIRKYSQNKADYVPFRQNGQVKLSYNYTVQVIAAKGTYMLYIVKPLAAAAISADQDR